MSFCVYGLIDPRTNELRYVGFTKNSKNRIAQHCRPSKLKANSYKNNWIKSIRANGLFPQIYILETYNSKEEALQAEIDLIAYYKWIGCQLTNVTKGGDEGADYFRSEKIRSNISKSSLGRKHTENTKKRISSSLTGIKRNHSEEHRKKISAALSGRKLPSMLQETKRKLSSLRKGQKAKEEDKLKSVKNNKNYKLTKENIINIKKLYQSKKYSQKEIAELFGISSSHASKIINNKSGKYLQ